MNTRIPGGDTIPDAPPTAQSLSLHTRTTYISSAYDQLPASQRHRVTGFISLEDFDFFFRDHCSVQGMQNKLVAGLIFPFINAFRAALTANPSLDPYATAIELINSITFTSHVQKEA